MKITKTLAYTVGAAILSVGMIMPASAQQTINLVNGDASCASAIQLVKFPQGPRPNLRFVELRIENPATANGTSPSIYVPELGTTFRVDLAQSPSDASTFHVRDASTLAADEGMQSQIADLPGFELVIMQRNNNAAGYFQVNMEEGDYSAPGTQTPSKITVCWAIGPCGLPSQTAVNGVCGAYNQGSATQRVDVIQAQGRTHFGESQPALDLCGCSTTMRFCDPAIPAGQPDSCNPNNEAFTGTSSTSAITSGAHSTLTYSNGSGTTATGTFGWP